MQNLRGPSAVSGLVARVRSLWRGIRSRNAVEAEMAEEFRHHVELRTADLVRQGLPPAEAYRRAHIEFGHSDSHKRDARASRGLRLLDEIGISWLDLKLGARMLIKYPGLSAVSVTGMAVAIAIGAAGFGVIDGITDTSLPLHEDERVISLQNADARRGGTPERRSLHDFLYWRDALGAVGDLSAFRDHGYNLVIPGRLAEPVRVAQMTASGFRVARVAPVLGRPLLESDERAGATPVVVIAHEEWQRLFAGDPAIIGTGVLLGSVMHTVVGVMPPGFRFPVKHRYWAPLRLDPTVYPVGEGFELHIFGRLADGTTLEQAQAELTTLGRTMAAQHPQTHGHLDPHILPYARPFLGMNSPGVVWGFRAIQLGVALVLLVVSVNVAILIYARTATRVNEIAVRSALGATRRRLVTQLFAEAFVLAVVAATIGLAIAGPALEWGQDFLERVMVDELPFWIDFGVSSALMTYVAGLAVLAGTVVGIVPALKATGRDVQKGLQALGSRGSQMQLGRTWTALIVVQVAIAVAGLPYAIHAAAESVKRGVATPGYPVDELLQAWFWFERGESPPADEAAAHEAAIARRFANATAELVSRLEAEPTVAGVTFASGMPGGEGPEYVQLEVEGTELQRPARLNRVAVNFLEVLDVPILTGRGFAAADTMESANTAIVDRTFADALLAGGGVLGRRVRQVTHTRSGEVRHGPWLEIVGMAPTVGVRADPFPEEPTLFAPAALGHATGVLAVRMRKGTAPAQFLGRLRDITAQVDPAFTLHELQTATEAEQVRRQGLLGMAVGVVAVTTSVLLLSAGGIYAMMAFTVARRRREIGIRAALGAAPRRLLGSIFARASAQLGGGVFAGLVLAVALDRVIDGGLLAREGIVLIPGVAGLMLVIGLLAAIIPARRGLAVQPTEALREE